MMGITGLGTGIDYMVMQSSKDADIFLKTFETYYRQGIDPNCIEQMVYSQTNINPDNFTNYDKRRITRKIEEICSGGGIC